MIFTRARVSLALLSLRENEGLATREKATFSRGVIFTRARVSLALLSLRENEGLLEVYGLASQSVYMMKS